VILLNGLELRQRSGKIQGRGGVRQSRHRLFQSWRNCSCSSSAQGRRGRRAAAAQLRAIARLANTWRVTLRPAASSRAHRPGPRRAWGRHSPTSTSVGGRPARRRAAPARHRGARHHACSPGTGPARPICRRWRSLWPRAARACHTGSSMGDIRICPASGGCAGRAPSGPRRPPDWRRPLHRPDTAERPGPARRVRCL
jgi:hypothetical protein